MKKPYLFICYILLYHSLTIYTGSCLAEDKMSKNHLSKNDPTQSISYLVATANEKKGKQLSIICQACHSFNSKASSTIGPNLYNIVNKKIASEKSYNYSKELSAVTGSWNFDQLSLFLLNPQKMIPGTKMVFAGLANIEDRAAVIAWLRLQSDKPVPLPTVTIPNSSIAVKTVTAENPDLMLLPEGAGKEEVFYACSTCHSIKLVVQQNMDRSNWAETLDWMVEDQEMARLDKKTNQLVLDYLSRYLGVDSTGN